ncbi:MAG: UDP-N-acetylmuramoyl-L-alanine--D-glutamate ligase [Christensenellaceae bacterium]
MDYVTQSFLVAGISRSGVSAAKFLLERGAKVALFDDSDQAEKRMDELEALGAKRVRGEESYDYDVLVLSPGIPIDHALPVAYRKAGKRIIGETELAAACLRATAVAVTGTNGKTTTVTLLGQIVSAQRPAAVCGNVGTPFLDRAKELSFDDVAIVEISSFQLETLVSFRPHVALILNVTEDHLDRHYNMDNYTFLKSRLIRSGTESEYAVLNHDDEIVRGFASLTRRKVVFFSAREKVDGAYLENGSLCYRGEEILPVDQLRLAGKHNVLNALAAIAVAKLLGVATEAIRTGLTEFKGVPHRNEFVREVGGVKYVNDSKGTNVDATIQAISNLTGETVLLLGGRDKGYEYEPLFEAVKRSGVVHTVLYGENRMKLVRGAMEADFSEVTVCSDFATAFSLASTLAKPGQTVLLSPASASFDEFGSYEERGEAFVAKVNALAS